MIETNSDCQICQRSTRCDSSRRRLHDSSDDDKENMQKLSPMKNEESSLSLYESEIPYHSECTGDSPGHCSHSLHSLSRDPLEHFDNNSQDSGYGMLYNSELGRFNSYASPTRSSRTSFGSLCPTIEDDFLNDISDLEPLDENWTLDFKKLISAPLSSSKQLVKDIPCVQQRRSPKDVPIRPLFRRALSFQNDNTPNSSRVRSSLLEGDIDVRPFKRSEPPTEVDSPSKFKRSKVFTDSELRGSRKALLKRSSSANEETIKYALQRSSEEELIGDFTGTYCLPLVQGRHQDLKSITSHTLAKLMNGDFKERIMSFKILDCRYPYEFDGGHISGAINIYNKDQCMKLLEEYNTFQPSTLGKSILIFHCEFSSERGPNLFRFLRQQDRNKNEYPYLQYPEIYLLEGGYKEFFGVYSQMCTPIAYKRMDHPEHEEELRFFRQKSKTLNSDSRHRGQYRGNRTRLGL